MTHAMMSVKQLTIRGRLMPADTKQPEPAPSKVMKVNLWLRVENNNKYIRGKTKVRDEIE